MTGVRVIPVPPLGHSSSCAICASVDSWAANRKRRPTGKQLAAMPDADFAAFIEDSGIGTVSRPTTRRAGEPDLAGGFWGATASRDVDRQPTGSPDLRASAVPITADGGAPRFGPAGLVGTADVQRQGASTRSSAIE